MNELKPPMLKREDYKAIKHMNREDTRCDLRESGTSASEVSKGGWH